MTPESASLIAAAICIFPVDTYIHAVTPAIRKLNPPCKYP